MTFDESYEDEIKVTVIASGFEAQSTEDILKKPSRDLLGRKIERNNAENFISRGTKNEGARLNNESKEDEMTIEDLETPAFIRKRLNS